LAPISETQKEIVMKNIAAVALFIVATFIAAGSAPAQDRELRANVPFNFTVNDQTLPSGAYTIHSSRTSSTILEIRNWDKKVAVLSLGQSNQSDPGLDNTLVFHKYGNQYFLSSIRSEGASMYIRFPKSKTEKRAKAQVEEAGIHVNEPVLIALR